MSVNNGIHVEPSGQFYKSALEIGPRKSALEKSVLLKSSLENSVLEKSALESGSRKNQLLKSGEADSASHSPSEAGSNLLARDRERLNL